MSQILAATASMEYFSKSKKELESVKKELGDKLTGKRVLLHYGSPFLAVIGNATSHHVEYPAPLGFSVSEDMYEELELNSYLIFEEIFSSDEPISFLSANARKPHYAAGTIKQLAEIDAHCVIASNGELLRLNEAELKAYLNRFCYEPMP